MTKAKRIFGVIFASILLLMSVVVISLYDNVRENTPRDDNLTGILEDDLQLFTIAMAKTLDSNFEAVSFDDSVDEQTRQIFLDVFDDYLKGITSLFNNDGDFIYKAVNTNTNQMISQHSEKITTNDDQSKYSFYTEASYDQNGLVSCNGDLSSDKLSYFNIANLLSSFAHYDGENTIYIDNWMFDTNAIKINVPKNLQITYIIPETPASHGYASQYVNSWENYNYFSAIALLSCSAILVLFILFYPIKIVEDVNPFLSVKRWKAEINLAVLTLMITFGVMGCMIVTGYTLNNSLLELLKRYDIMYVDYIVIVINFVIWILTLLVISLGIFQLKYIFARGFWRYLKEDTLIGSGVRSIKNKLNQIADIDLSKSLNQTIMKYILINTAIIMIMITFWGFGYFLAIIYAFLVFFWVKDKVLKVQDDYDKLLTATKELSKGNFDVEIDVPGKFSVYNSLTAIAICHHFNVSVEDMKKALKEAKTRGRIEMVKVSDEFTLMIDYAHNAMSLESLLSTLKEYGPERLVCVFGCGGNRSKLRRYEMGEVSGRLADFTIITSDNPRFEEPQAIIDDIKTGIEKTDGKYIEIIDRKEAIRYAIEHGKPGDVIVLAGKGHEDYQEIKGVKHPMDERVLIAEVLKELHGE